MRRGAVRTALAACALELVACAPEAGDPFVPIYESERLRIGASFDAQLCLGDRDMWEAHLDSIEETLDVSRDFTWLFLYRDDEKRQIAQDCGWDDVPSGLLGCWRNPVVRTTHAAVTHELVHAWTASVQRRPLSLLSEGLAVRMAGMVPRARTEPSTVDDMLLSALPFERYPAAGHFVAWLMVAYGAETFMTLYTRASEGMTEPELSAVFLEVMGETPEDVLLAYKTLHKAYYPALGAAGCGQGPLISWQNDAATWPAEGSCSEGPFFGYETSDWWQRVTIDVATSGTYLLDTGGRAASLTRCLTAPADELELPELPEMVTGDWLHPVPMDDLNYAFGFGPGENWADVPLELDAGIYEVWVERRSRELPGWGSEMSLLRL